MKKRRDKKRSESGASADGRGERTTRISGFCVEGLGRNVRVGGRGKAGGDKGKVGMNRVLLAKNRLIRVRSGSITCYCTVFATADIVALNGTYTSRTQLEVMQSKTTKQRACLDDVLFALTEFMPVVRINCKPSNKSTSSASYTMCSVAVPR